MIFQVRDMNTYLVNLGDFDNLDDLNNFCDLGLGNLLILIAPAFENICLLLKIFATFPTLM